LWLINTAAVLAEKEDLRFHGYQIRDLQKVNVLLALKEYQFSSTE
jgi:hypothetical protein